MVHVAHAAAAIAAGRCNVALITLAGRPKAEGMATGTAPRAHGPSPEVPFELPYSPTGTRTCGFASSRKKSIQRISFNSFRRSPV